MLIKFFTDNFLLLFFFTDNTFKFNKFWRLHHIQFDSLYPQINHKNSDFPENFTIYFRKFERDFNIQFIRLRNDSFHPIGSADIFIKQHGLLTRYVGTKQKNYNQVNS